MKKIIKNNNNIRFTANGENIVDGSLAKINAINFDSNGTFSKITSCNNNFYVDNEYREITSGTLPIFFSEGSDLVDLINSTPKPLYLYVSQEICIKNIYSITNPNLSVSIDGTPTIDTTPIYTNSFTKRKVFLTISSNVSNIQVNLFNYDSLTPVTSAIYAISQKNQILLLRNNVEPDENVYIKHKEDTYTISTPISDVPSKWIPESGVLITSSSISNTGSYRNAFYRAFNQGYEKIVGSNFELETEYCVEKNQYKENTRFDFFRLDGESFSGIGYENLKTTNQLTYPEEPSRQEDGSMQNIEQYDSFVLGAGDIGFSLMSEDTYRRLKEKLISKRTFEVEYYDSDFNCTITRNMYVKPQDLQAFLSYGNKIIGMRGFTISFVATMNEENEINVKFYDANGEVSETKTAYWGRSIEIPTAPDGYNCWLVTKSGFNNGNYLTINSGQKLNVFGETELVPFIK